MENKTLIRTGATRVLQFNKLEAKHIPLLQQFFRKYPSRSCDFSVAGVLMWVDYFEYEFAISHDSLFIKGRIPDTDTYIFYRPVGKVSLPESEKLIRQYCSLHNIEGMILLPEELEADAQPFNSLEDPLIDDWKEYLYDAERFRSFAGKKMEKKRNHLNFFHNNYADAVIEDVSMADICDLIDFTIRFDAEHYDDDLSRYECEQTVNVLREYDKYGYIGKAFRYHGKIIGYTFGEVIGDTLFAHVEKGNIEYRGVYQALASALCQEGFKVNPDLKYVNREEDMGYESLRQSKLSYHPTLFIHKRLRCLD